MFTFFWSTKPIRKLDKIIKKKIRIEQTNKQEYIFFENKWKKSLGVHKMQCVNMFEAIKVSLHHVVLSSKYTLILAIIKKPLSKISFVSTEFYFIPYFNPRKQIPLFPSLKQSHGIYITLFRIKICVLLCQWMRRNRRNIHSFMNLLYCVLACIDIYFVCIQNIRVQQPALICCFFFSWGNNSPKI